MSDFRFKGTFGPKHASAPETPQSDAEGATEAEDGEGAFPAEITYLDAEKLAQALIDEEQAQVPTVVDRDWEPTPIVVACAMGDCSHNYRGYCSGVDGQIHIIAEPDMGTSTRATECAYYDSTTASNE